MRFLHTADWHVGKQLKGRSRASEYEAVLAEILDIARRERVDVVLVAGDLFESHAPSPDAERIIYEFFAELVACRIPAVVIAGNHDHSARLEGLRRLLDPMRIYLRSEPARPDAGGVVEIRANGECARIAALPFVSDRKLIDSCRLLAPEDTWYAEYAENVAAMCGILAGAWCTSTVNILMGHLYAHGAETSGSEREVHVSAPYAVMPARLPATAHYVALGHLHRAQRVSAPGPAWYSGSALQLDFGECGQQKQVILIDAAAGRPARIEPLPLVAGRRLQTLSATLEEIERSAAEYGDDYLRVHLRCSTALPGLAARVRDLLPNAVEVRLEYPAHEPDAVPPSATLTAHERFAAYYARERGTPPPDALLAAFRQIHEEVLDAPGAA